MDDPQRATGAQRLGSLLAFVEALVLGFLAALHFGFDWTIAGTRYDQPLLIPTGIVEALLALGLILAVLIPADGAVRAGRVLAAQILTVIGVFADQVMLGVALTNLRGEVYQGVVLALALASLALISSPAYRRRPVIVAPPAA